MAVQTFPVLSTAERDRRWEATRSFLQANDLSALVVAGAPRGLPHYLGNTRGGIIVFPRASPPVYLGGWMEKARKFDDERAGIEPWIADSRIVGDAPAVVAELVEERGLAGTRVGVTG